MENASNINITLPSFESRLPLESNSDMFRAECQSVLVLTTSSISLGLGGQMQVLHPQESFNILNVLILSKYY